MENIFDKTKFESATVDGVVTLSYKDDKAFGTGTELTHKQLKEAADYAHTYIEKATEVAAEVAKETMEKDDKINKVIVDYPYSVSKRGELTVAIDRSKTYTIPNSDETVTKSAIKVAVKDPITKISKPRIKDLEAELTAALVR